MKLLKTVRETARSLWRRFRTVLAVREETPAGSTPLGFSSERGDRASAAERSDRMARSSASTSRWVSLLVLLGIVIAMGFLFYRVMASFVVPIFLAILLTVMFRPLHLAICRRLGGYVQIGAGITTALILTIVLAPVGWMITLAVKDGVQLVAGVDIEDVEQGLAKVRATFGLQMESLDELRAIERCLERLAQRQNPAPAQQREHGAAEALSSLAALQDELGTRQAAYDESIGQLAAALRAVDGPEPVGALQDAQFLTEQLQRELAGGPVEAWLKQRAYPTEEEIRLWRGQAVTYLQNNVVSATGATTDFVVKLVVGTLIMIVCLYFFLADGPALLNLIMHLSPLDEVYERELLLEFDRISRAVVLATILSALVQALLAGVSFWLVGVGSVFLLMLLTFVLAMVPFVGAASVWVPVCLYLYFYEDRLGAALFLLAYGTLVISLADNVIKPLVLHGQSRLHPLLALLSILGGVQALGPIGIFVGPMAVSFLQTLLNLLHQELISLDEADKVVSEAPGEDAPAGAEASERSRAEDEGGPQESVA